MRVTYNGGDAPQTWKRVVLGDTLTSDAEQVEQALGRTWDDFVVGLRAGDSRCRRAFLWLLMRREHPTMPFADVPDFRMRDFVVEYDADEIREIMRTVEEAMIPEDRKRAHLDGLEIELNEAIVREALDEVDAETTSSGQVDEGKDDPVPGRSAPSAKRPRRSSPRSTGSARGRSTS